MTVEHGLLTRTALFQQHIIAKRDTLDAEWELYDEGPTIDEQVQKWVEKTGNLVIAASAPGYSMGWLDEELLARSIMVGVVIIYRPALESQYAKRDNDPATNVPADTSAAGADSQNRTTINIAGLQF